MRTIHFNGTSETIVAPGDQKLRVSEYKGVISIRPSTRVNCVKGEALGALNRDEGITTVVDFNVEPGTYGIERGRYGWFILGEVKPGVPTITID